MSTTHDAIVGYWDGKTASGDIGKPRNYERLDYLSSSRRRQVIMADLACNFRVIKNRTTVQLLFGDDIVCDITPPGQDLLRDQLTYLRNYSDLRMDRIAEINIQANDILSFFGAHYHLNAQHRERTLELLTITQDLTIQIEMMVKHFCWLPRPIEFSANVQPIIQTPDHSTFPSGHSTESFAVATVLHRLATGEPAVDGLRKKAPPFRLAHRIAVNRTIAGVHYPVDSAAGAMLGCAIGEALHALHSGKPGNKFVFGDKGYNLDKKNDEELSQDFTLQNLGAYAEAINKSAADDADSKVPDANLFAAFWEDASSEFTGGAPAADAAPEGR